MESVAVQLAVHRASRRTVTVQLNETIGSLKTTASVLSVTSVPFGSLAASYCKLKQAIAAYCRDSSEKIFLILIVLLILNLVAILSFAFLYLCLKRMLFTKRTHLKNAQLIVYQ